MSPRERNRSVPSKLRTSKEVAGGEDRDEWARVDARRGAEPGSGGDIESPIGGHVVGGELSPGEAPGTAVSGGRREGIEASERGGCIESCAAHGRARARVGAGAREVQRIGRC